MLNCNIRLRISVGMYSKELRESLWRPVVAWSVARVVDCTIDLTAGNLSYVLSQA